MFSFPKDNFVFLETNKFDEENFRSYLFFKPIKIISCHRIDDIHVAFSEIERLLGRGYYAAGYISYEAGLALEDTLKRSRKESILPLLWFGIYKDPVISKAGGNNSSNSKREPYKMSNPRSNTSREEYVDNIKKIKRFIRRGDTYQVNYTFKYKFNFRGSVYSLYKDLRQNQRVSYSAFINTGDFSILSLSPELFFRKERGIMEVRPMKGTFERGIDLKEDRRNMKALEKSLKNRSENVMIVDLLRNDLGRVSKPGTVRTQKLFQVETYETLLQMISIVTSRLRKEIGLYDLFKAIFPSGSVTGAPKISTMKIINDLEKEPRNVYTGAIGFFAPDGDSVFNVAIRTILVNSKTGKAEMGVGSGIVYDSDPDKEFEECKLKTNFLTQSKEDFRLIETMLWRPGKGYYLLGRHLRRLYSSADYFGFKYEEKHFEKELKKLERKFKTRYHYRTRVLLDRNGKFRSSFSRIPGSEAKIERVKFSSKKVSSKEIFFYHKTTRRNLYNEEFNKWRKKGYFDVIFTNEKNQVTEGSISNIIIKKGKSYYTPPVICGLLNGIYRGYLLENKKIPLKEKVLYERDLRRADEIYMVNSVRGMVKVAL